MVENIFKGLGVALITPFTPDGSVDYNSLRRLLEYQIEGGADFFCILATTGEVPCLTADEKERITQVVKEVNKGRLPILKYCGGNNTSAVIDEIRHTDWKGFTSISRLYLQPVRFRSFCITSRGAQVSICSLGLCCDWSTIVTILSV